MNRAAKQTPAEKPMRKLSDKQREVMLKLRRGWRIMFGPTGSSHHVNGSASFSFGDMLCPPGCDSGQTITGRMIDALQDRGLLEEVKREKPLDTSSIESILRGQSEARESHRLTEKGRTCLLP